MLVTIRSLYKIVWFLKASTIDSRGKIVGSNIGDGDKSFDGLMPTPYSVRLNETFEVYT